MLTEPPTLAPELDTILAASRLGDAPLTWRAADELPEPCRRLLVHDSDMTSALAGFHDDAIALRVLDSHRRDPLYLREVTLHAATSGEVVEYGLIAIDLDAFPADLRPLILAGDTPLGELLNDSGLPYHSRPQGFFSVPASALEGIFPSSSGGGIRFGRYNHLVRDDGPFLARILEILPHAP